MNKSVIISIFLFLSLMLSVTAVTITDVRVAEPDTFYSGFADNDDVNLVVNISNINGTVADVVVTADFSGLDVNCGGSGAIITLSNVPGTNTWIGSCSVGDEATSMVSNTFKSKPVWIKANETNGPSDVNSNLTLSLYNIIVPSPVGNCYRFNPTESTNFNSITNFNNVDINLVIELKDDSACVGVGYNWFWLKVAELKFNGVNFNNNFADAAKLVNLSNIVKYTFSLPETYQNHRLTIDTTKLSELNVNTFNVNLYHLSLINPKEVFIVSDTVQASAITWTPNGEAIFNSETYDLAFTVTSGFKGFTITDNILPTITLNSPSSTEFNTSEILISATINGTGTGVSKALFYINNVSNTANCTVVSSEVSTCTLLLNKNDGSYNLVISAYDYGNVSGNVASINRSFTVQTSAPSLVVRSPTAGIKYTGTAGSMLKLNFTTSDGNGIDECRYTLNGPTALNNVLISNCSEASVQLYLQDGDYTLFISSKDTLGKINSTNISFSVDDTKAPVITNNTKLSKKNNITLSISTDEKATCKYSTTDVAYEKMKSNFEDNILLHTDDITLSAPDKVFNYFVKCSDLSGNANKDSLQISLYYGDITNATVAPIINATKQDPFESLELKVLSAGKNNIMFDKTINPIELISLITNTVANDLVLKVILVSTPTATYSEKVYKYISIEHAALRDSNIDGANITFRVEKSWLANNSVSKNSIVLMRYSGNWVELSTGILREDDTNVYYLANSPGLSLFAISKKATIEAPTVPVVTTNTRVNTTSDNLDLLTKRSYNLWWVILLSIIVFVIIVLFILVQRNDRINPPIFAEDRTLIGRIRRLFK